MERERQIRRVCLESLTLVTSRLRSLAPEEKARNAHRCGDNLLRAVTLRLGEGGHEIIPYKIF